MTDFLRDGPDDAPLTMLLAHGAGAAMDSPAMTAAAQALAAEGLAVARFEFAYMAARRAGGSRRPPPRADRLLDEYRAAVDALPPGPLVIGGKSMGGRVASMLGDELHASGRIAGVLCLGYPFHPPAKPDTLRTAHLETLTCPTLIVQGTRDPFGTADEVPGYALSPAVQILWLEDGDHDLKPRKRVTGLSAADHMATMAARAAAWAKALT
ncbi:alpha/beta family hydrolase [Psychromarinibacter halotolerans]|uniref:Alpha/beta family hydrolase n=1 Tax=Psychromarinibacter halotolerans TaxID=1775175 RepID=A0ABV7GQ35_9RHOB|nr:alpha/beta family hydrolase [Psychromarinibacter halotolerans]MDF0597343.1 alpha/beta hydrolase [Psychromarinibacter halotolerans]